MENIEQGIHDDQLCRIYCYEYKKHYGASWKCEFKEKGKIQRLMEKNPKVPEKDKCQPVFGLFQKIVQRFDERQDTSSTDCDMTQNTDDICI